MIGAEADTHGTYSASPSRNLTKKPVAVNIRIHLLVGVRFLVREQPLHSTRPSEKHQLERRYQFVPWLRPDRS